MTQCSRRASQMCLGGFRIYPAVALGLPRCSSPGGEGGAEAEDDVGNNPDPD